MAQGSARADLATQPRGPLRALGPRNGRRARRGRSGPSGGSPRASLGSMADGAGLPGRLRGARVFGVGGSAASRALERNASHDCAGPRGGRRRSGQDPLGRRRPRLQDRSAGFTRSSTPRPIAPERSSSAPTAGTPTAPAATAAPWPGSTAVGIRQRPRRTTVSFPCRKWSAS